MENFNDECRELQCVGRLEIIRPKPIGFLCGSIPVPTDASFHVFNSKKYVHLPNALSNYCWNEYIQFGMFLVFIFDVVVGLELRGI